MGNFLGRAFILQPIWYLSAGISELPNEGEGLHCPLPRVPDIDYIHQGHDSLPVKFLLHFANYFFPLFSTKGGRSPPVEMSGSLSRSQMAAIHYVTEFIQSRYYNDGFSLPLPFSLSLSPCFNSLPPLYFCNMHNYNRYKSLSEDWSQFLKVWPGYVYWARGQLKLAANAFVSSLDQLKHCMQLLYYNDITLYCSVPGKWPMGS